MLCGSKHRTPSATLQSTTTQLPAIALREKSARAWIWPRIAAASIKPSGRSATPLNWGLSAVVNSCLILRDLQRSQNFPPRNSPPASDRTITTLEGTLSALVSARNCSTISAASNLWRTKYTHVYREISSHTMNVYRFCPERLYHLSSTLIHKTLPSFLSARGCVGCITRFRRPFDIEHPMHSSSFPSRIIPCCSTVLRSSSSWECPAAQW